MPVVCANRIANPGLDQKRIRLSLLRRASAMRRDIVEGIGHVANDLLGITGHGPGGEHADKDKGFLRRTKCGLLCFAEFCLGHCFQLLRNGLYDFSSLTNAMPTLLMLVPARLA
jgi:hypothetical protein